MTKASEAGTDPFMALLDWRNTPSAQLGLSPVQVLFGRRTRTNLPTAAALLTPPAAPVAQAALVTAKQRQAHYYNKRAKARAPIPIGSTVRARFDEGDWRKAEVTRILPHRSYEVTFEGGSNRRRTSRQIHTSRESPIIIKTEEVEEEEEDTPAQRPAGPNESDKAATEMPDNASTERENVQSQSRTRSGRLVRKPERFREN